MSPSPSLPTLLPSSPPRRHPGLADLGARAPRGGKVAALGPRAPPDGALPAPGGPGEVPPAPHALALPVGDQGVALERLGRARLLQALEYGLRPMGRVEILIAANVSAEGIYCDE